MPAPVAVVESPSQMAEHLMSKIESLVKAENEFDIKKASADLDKNYLSAGHGREGICSYCSAEEG